MSAQLSERPASGRRYGLSRLRPIVGCVLYLVWIAAGAPALLGPLSLLSEGFRIALVLGVLAPFLVAWLLLLRIATAHMPVAVEALPSGLQVQWANRVEQYPWSTLQWRHTTLSDACLAATSPPFAVHTWWVADKDRDNFAATTLDALALAKGEQEAQHLADGAVIELPVATRRMMLTFILSGVAYAVTSVVIYLNHLGLPLSEVDDPVFRLAFIIEAALIALLAFLVGRRLVQTLWRRTRFLPDGLEQSWPGGRLFVPYGAIDGLTEKRDRERLSLTLSAGRQRLWLNTQSPLFFGAAALLQQRADTAHHG